MAMPQVAKTIIRLSAHFLGYTQTDSPAGCRRKRYQHGQTGGAGRDRQLGEDDLLTVRPRCFKLRPISPWTRLFI